MPYASAEHPERADVTAEQIDASAEQRWNDAALEVPVTEVRLRCWRYATPAVVLGRSQRAWRPALPAGPLPLIDRRAGGGAVLVGPWLLSASIVLPLADPRVRGESVADSYRWIGEAFVAALAEQGLRAASVPRDATRAAPAELAWACFAGVAPWELVVAGRKIVGFAQRRSRNGVLIVAGALLAPVPWLLLCRALGRPDRDAAALAAMTIDAAEVLGSPLSGDALAAGLAARIA